MHVIFCSMSEVFLGGRYCLVACLALDVISFLDLGDEIAFLLWHMSVACVMSGEF